MIFSLSGGARIYTQFTKFMDEINKLHSTIKFTHEVSKIELVFLDVTVDKGNRFKQKNILDTRTHIKSTNKQLYIHATSYHLPAILAAFSKGETHSYLRTNSENQLNNDEKSCT